MCACACVCMCIHAMECYSAIEKNDIISFVTTWMDIQILCYVKYDSIAL